MFCTKCGEKLNEGAKFCPTCGTKIVEEAETTNETKIPVETPKVTNTTPGNNSTKTASIVLGVISIITCCTVFIPIILGIVGIMLAVKARKEDKSFKAGFILNIIGIVLVVVFGILAVVGLVMIGLNTEGKLTHDWCCSSTFDTSKCAIKINLDDDYNYTLKDQYETNSSRGTWDYDWLDYTKSKGDKYTLTLDHYDYTVYIKDKHMTLYDGYDDDTPMMYCTRK